MITETRRHTTESFAFGELIQSIADGELVLPDFQRDFVWNPNRVSELLDSVSRGWPIGSLLMLEGPQPFGLKEVAFGPKVTATEARWYLLDGQQRLTSLYLAIWDLGDVVYFVDTEAPDEHDEYPFQWIRRSRYKTSDTRFTFRELLVGSLFSGRLESLSSHQTDSISEIRQRRMGPLLEGYFIPAIVMSSDIPLEALTRIFETLNRTGLRLNAFDLMVAVLRPHGFHLRDAWAVAVENHPLFEALEVDGVEVLKLIALWQRDIDLTSSRPSARKVKGVRQGDVLNVPGVFVQAEWSRAVEAYNAALDLVVSLTGARDKQGVPSWAMLLPIAYWLDRSIDSARVRRWYWQAVSRQTYAQGANTQVIADAQAGPSLDGASNAVEALRAGLLDQSRRNRILRLAIRGLAFARTEKGNFPQWSSGREVSIEGLTKGQIGLDGSEPVVDTIYLPSSEITRIRKHAFADESLVPYLQPGSLEAQGFDRLHINDRAMRQASRIDQLVTWVGELV